MEFGMPTLIEAPGVAECVELAKKLGLSFIELNMNMPQYQADAMPVLEIERCMAAHGIYFTLHLDENLNVCDFNKNVSNAYVNTVLYAINLSKQLGIPVLNMHMPNGVYFTLPDKKVFLFEKYKDTYMESIKYFKGTCEKAVGAGKVKICMENCDGYAEFSRQAIECLLESDVFALTLDIGHSHSARGVDEDFILEHADKLAHMHIHDAKGNQNHLPLGEGEIDIPSKLKLAQSHNCRCVLETKTIDGLTLSACRLNEYLRYL